MANEAGWKLLQKQAYDLLSHRYGSIALAAFTVLLIVSVLQFGEVRHHKLLIVLNALFDHCHASIY